MTHSHSRGKLSQNKIKRQSKPFIDEDLQIQIPGSDQTSQDEENHSQNPIYSHYSTCYPAISLLSQISEEEIHQAIKHCQESHDAWRKMKEYLKAHIK